LTKPSITGTTHGLPFDKLSPRDFEWLCLRLVKREGFERAEHLDRRQRKRLRCHRLAHLGKIELG
jgi:hypothetical protein